MQKRTIYIIVAVVIVVLLIVAYNSKKGPEDVGVFTEMAASRTIVESVSANGKVQPEIEVKISPDVSGEIVELPVKEGDHVAKGDLLVRIRPDIYVSMRDRMEASLNTARANLANSKARLSQSEAQLVVQEANHKRMEKLFNQGAISETEWENAKSAYQVAAAEVEAAKQSVVGAEFNVKSAQASLKEASDNLEKTTIFAPVDGTVSMLNVELGERVVGTSQMAGTEMMRIADLGRMEVNVEVNENDIVKVRLGQRCDIEVDAFIDRNFEGVVTEIANSANTQGISADQVTTFEVKIRLLRSSYADLVADTVSDSPFRPGMSSTVEIRTGKADQVVTIPIQAVTTREDSSQTNEFGESLVNEVVFLLQEDKAIMKNVKTGLQDTRYIEVKDGINVDDKVIIGPYSVVSRELMDGQTVEVKEKSDLYKKFEKRKQS